MARPRRIVKGSSQPVVTRRRMKRNENKGIVGKRTKGSVSENKHQTSTKAYVEEVELVEEDRNEKERKEQYSYLYDNSTATRIYHSGSDCTRMSVHVGDCICHDTGLKYDRGISADMLDLAEYLIEDYAETKRVLKEEAEFKRMMEEEYAFGRQWLYEEFSDYDGDADNLLCSLTEDVNKLFGEGDEGVDEMY